MSDLSHHFDSSRTLEQPIGIKDVAFEIFLKHLSIESIRRFSEECKAKHIEMKGIQKDIKIPKKVFLSLMQSAFGTGKLFIPLYQSIFSRFKIVKCGLIMPSIRNSSFFINKIIPEEEIDVYEVSCALVCFVKCNSQSKLHLLFDLTDIDDDGYINKEEIKRLIYTLNCLFSIEEQQMETSSTIVSQSLAANKSNHIFQMLIHDPGELSTVIAENTYINFDQFYSAIQRIESKSIEILPFFVNFKECLLTKRTENEININRNNFRDYEHVSNDLVSNIKNNNITDNDKSIQEFKKNLMYQKLSAGHYKGNSSNRISDKLRSHFKELSLLNKEVKQSPTSRTTRLSYLNKKEGLKARYNTINYLETYPGKITLVDKDKRDISTNINDKLPIIPKLTLLTDGNIQQNKLNSSYRTFEEILSEIELIFNNKKYEEQVFQHLNMIKEKIKNKAVETKRFFSNPSPNTYQNLVVRQFVNKRKKSKGI